MKINFVRVRCGGKRKEEEWKKNGRRMEEERKEGPAKNINLNFLLLFLECCINELLPETTSKLLFLAQMCISFIILAFTKRPPLKKKKK